MRRSGKLRSWDWLALIAIVVIVSGFILYRIHFQANYYVEEINEYSEPPVANNPELTDDSLEGKNPAFIETLIDSRPLGDWEINASSAVIRLDCPAIKPELDYKLLDLQPSFADALEKSRRMDCEFLPSANLLDASAKQFDDGLYAALDLACYRGALGFALSAPDWIHSLFLALPEKSPARPFLAGALELAGKPEKLTPDEERQKKELLAEFEQNPVRSKPIAFYTWTPELRQVWKFYRFLQWNFDKSRQSIPDALSAALAQNEPLVPPYRSIYTFYTRLTNPPLPRLQPLMDFVDPKHPDAPADNARPADFVRTVFPPSTSREVELFEALFPTGLPSSVNLMSELIRRVRSGKVRLEPKKNDGWYQYQAYALEAMLLPVQCQENEKLQLTAAYKRRLVEAFKALLTKRRETHARQICEAKCADKAPPAEVRPRLRIEPCATFYLRTARAYAFLQNFLLATVGEDRLSALHGLKEGGARSPTLAEELDAMRLRFYGFYLVACEDLGMEPKLLPDEPVDRKAATDAALAWLTQLDDDPDLKCDTRASIPIAYDPVNNRTRLWATLGVRFVPLEASYARPPKIRPKEEGGDWRDPSNYTLGKSDYLLAVDEFAEFELPGAADFTREEFRALCDKNQGDKKQILQALQSSQ